MVKFGGRGERRGKKTVVFKTGLSLAETHVAAKDPHVIVKGEATPFH